MQKNTIDILIIGEDPSFRASLAAALAGEGHRVRETVDLPSGLEILGNEVFQLVVFDHGRVEAADSELIRAVRGFNASAGVIVCTSELTVEDVVELMKLGVDDVLIKPFPEGAALETIHGVIAKRDLCLPSSYHVNQAIGARLRETRLARKMTLRQLANRTGLSISLISQIELAKTSASISTLYKATNALGIKLGALFEEL